MQTFTHLPGRAYLSVAERHPDPERRYLVTVSDNFQIGADGLRELAAWLNAFADDVAPKAKPKGKQKAPPTPAPAADTADLFAEDAPATAEGDTA